ncbi:LexA family protein [Photobacterium galatheae]|nr:XRE family transcriptional regulator [Photobacterium galatheae]MCM0148167.1 helix-turn-helix domain-containing protein [Photobacterium galatheae]
MTELIVHASGYKIEPMVQSEKMREEFSTRLAQACIKAGIEEHGRGVIIAKRLGVTPKAVSKWLNAESMPRRDKMSELASFLGVDLYWLQFGDESRDASISNVIPVVGVPTDYRSEFPVISSVVAGMWTEAIEPYHLEEIDTYLPTTERVSERSFWLEVKGDSMTSGSGISFPSGTMILVDPEIEPESGKLVVAKLTDVNEATFKQLIIDAGQKFLKPLNPSYPIMPINGNCKIIGVVKDAKLKLF